MKVNPEVKEENSYHHQDAEPISKENNSNRCNSVTDSNADASILSLDSKDNSSNDSDFQPEGAPKQRPRKAYHIDYDDMYVCESFNSTQDNVRRSSRQKKPVSNFDISECENRRSSRYAFRNTSRSQGNKRVHSSSDSEMRRGYGEFQSSAVRSSKRRPFANQRESIREMNGIAVDVEEGDLYERVKNRRRSRQVVNFREEDTDDAASGTESETKEDELGQVALEALETQDEPRNQQVPGLRSARRSQRSEKRSSSSDDDKLSLRKGYALRPNRPSFTMIEQLQKSPLGMKRPKKKHQRKKFAHNSSSSSDSSSSDESSFERKKASKLAKARSQCLPLNMKPADLLKGTLCDRIKVGSSLADIEPMTIDKSITFESIGGLNHHINSLKEMVLFPLLYPEVFERFKVQSPRGVLFYGPPGTGKTLVARALANECSTDGKKVAFFMRKGADCMSKWVGESERQLRLLFDQAYSMRPAIIFFDEIDGIAPVRSTRQDQIHSSIVSTLLALMDGLDSRGEVIVIGATNRIEAIDPALRRPGRFDREFYFPLPTYEARKKIINIHTKDWQPPPDACLIDTLASRTVGYCGADLKALCSEAVLLALRRRYQQIYSSKNKLKLNLNEISVTLKEFNTAINKKIVPAAQRSVSAIGSPLPLVMKPLLAHHVSEAAQLVKCIFPHGFQKPKNLDDTGKLSDSDDDIDESLLNNEPVLNLRDGNRSLRYAGIFKPRVVIHGLDDFGQDYVAKAILNEMEQINCYKIDSSKSIEEISTWFGEVIKRLPLPSVLYAPTIEELDDHLYTHLVTLLDSIESTIPLLFIATSKVELQSFDEDVKKLFEPSKTTLRSMCLQKPSITERRAFFSPLFKKLIKKPISNRKWKHMEILEEIPIEAIEPRKLSEKELSKLRKKENAALRELRLFLRDILSKITRDRRFGIFLKPVDVGEVPDYYKVIEKPMDLESMMVKIDTCQYETAKDFLSDIELICSNALEYNPARDSADRQIRHRACSLRDFAHALLEAEMNSDFEEYCQEIHENRLKRNESPTKSVPPTLRVPALVIPIPESAKDDDTEIESVTEVNSSNNSTTDPSSQATIIARAQSAKKLTKKKPKKRAKSTVEEVQSITNCERGSGDVSLSGNDVSVTLSERDTMASITNKSQVDTIPDEVDVLVDEDKLNGSLDKIVRKSDNFNVPQLENLLWSLFRLIKNRQKDLDKSLLLEVRLF